MGTHPFGESIITGIGQSYENIKLSVILNDLPELIGTMDIFNKYGANIPFLFKVLSVAQPLSIQVHPNKDQAKQLHSKDPKNYPDNNHKPEISIALTEFEALCSFRTHDDLEKHLKLFPFLSELIGEQLVDNYTNELDCFKKRDLLKQMFTSLMNSNDDLIQQILNELEKSFTEDLTKEIIENEEIKRLFLRIKSFYPKDIGCLSVFLLNYVKFQPGQCIFIDAGEPHCYLLGDCIECMACSDNTIRAGLTPKFKDLENLINCLTYSTKSSKNCLINPQIVDFSRKTYKTKAEEFCVDQLRVGEDKDLLNYTLDKKESASIIIVVEGQAKANEFKLFPGFVFFLPALTELKISITQKTFTLFRAYFLP